MALALAAVATLVAADPAAEGNAAPAPARQVKLPGLEINTKEGFVDVQSAVCLEQGSLELIACTKGSKEHESILIVEARPIHIHAALLLLGAKNGNPAMRRPVNKEGTRWVDVLPQGDPVELYLVWKNADGTMVERPISDFITRSDSDSGAPAEDKKKAKFPSAFVFAGSQLGDPNRTPREYLAESSGNVISISTFGDELLCLSGVQGHDNGALEWQIDPTHLPKLHSKVTLRLRVRKAKQ